MGRPEPIVVDLAPGVTAAFTTRAGGASGAPYADLNLGLHVGDEPATVVANRQTATASLGLDLDQTVWCEQVHGEHVAAVTGTDAGRGARSRDDAVSAADGLVSEDRDLALAVLVADCVPLLLADRRGGAVAAVHAGRRGLAAGIVSIAVGTLLDAGARRDDVVAAIGPCIGPCCYEVGADVHAEVTAAVAQTDARTRGGALALDLPGGVRRVLAEEGVTAVRAVGGCTAHQPGRFYSHRRDGVTGRLAGLIWRHG